MEINSVSFVKSAYSLSQLPSVDFPEIAFAGRSNVGKSSLINRLVGRRSLVKVSSQPGKTQSLNYFLVNDAFYLVDLPGYGYAKVPKKIRDEWRTLIESFLSSRESLRCVVVIVDIRHEVKAQDLQLIEWLRDNGIRCLPVYTKIDKLSGNQVAAHARQLDAAFSLTSGQRLLFSSKTGDGRENLLSVLDQLIT